MNVRYQIFIIVVIIYSSYGALANCPCDVLEVDSGWLVEIQKFTKQIGTLNGKPYYFSTKWNLISWKDGTPPYWSLERYNDFSKEFEKIKTFTKKKMFSFQDMCKPLTVRLFDDNKDNIVTKTQCLSEISNCPNTRRLTTTWKNGNHSKTVNLQAKYYDDSCPPPEKADKADEVTGKSKYLIIGILVGVFIIVGIIIGYICIKKRKGVPHPNTHANEEYTLENSITGYQAGIDSNEAADLSYSGKHEIEENKFEIGKKIGGGSFGSVYKGTLTGKNTKVAIKQVNDSRDRTQVFALMCEIKVLDKLDKHLNLVNMVGACTSQISNGKLWLLLEYCPCGDMKNFLNKKRDVFIEGNHKRINRRLFIEWGYGISKGKEEQSGETLD